MIVTSGALTEQRASPWNFIPRHVAQPFVSGTSLALGPLCLEGTYTHAHLHSHSSQVSLLPFIPRPQFQGGPRFQVEPAQRGTQPGWEGAQPNCSTGEAWGRSLGEGCGLWRVLEGSVIAVWQAWDLTGNPTGEGTWPVRLCPCPCPHRSSGGWEDEELEVHCEEEGEEGSVKIPVPGWLTPKLKCE